ncbi:MAG: hypothetical protein KDD61_00055 [Bdellovibrionales bacterium]|nr:hypothetical protein [Bdellovibrionales bacterium]
MFLILRLFLVLVCPFVFGCGYQMGYGERRLPENYRSLAVVMFENATEEVGVEKFFTNALVQQFALSKVAVLTKKSLAPAILEGRILSIEVEHEVPKSNSDLVNLPDEAILTTQYRLRLQVRLVLKRVADGRIIWQEVFAKERTYSAPQVATAIVNSANPLYNHSARLSNIRLMAEDMMIDAHDRLTERF